MTPQLVKAQFLIERTKFKEAEEILRQEIGREPENARAHSFLALSLVEQNQPGEALLSAQTGIRLNPDDAYGYVAQTAVFIKLERSKDARKSIMEAIRLNPNDARYYGFLSRTYVLEQEWSEALGAANDGLRIDPEEAVCTNFRALALVQLGHKDEAGVTIANMLSREPENAMAHANQGWALLHRNQPKEAMIHFREALRLNPEMTWAQIGITEAMKAGNPIYRVMLVYFLWMARLSPKTKWMVVLGAYVLFRLVRSFSLSNPELSPFLQPLIYIYLVFVVLSWTSIALFDLLLRLSRFGRLALTRMKIVASNWIGSFLLLALALFVGSLLIDDLVYKPLLSELALKTAVFIIPLSSVFTAKSSRKNYKFLVKYAAALAIFAILDPLMRLRTPPLYIFSTLYWFGFVGYVWTANIILTRR